MKAGLCGGSGAGGCFCRAFSNIPGILDSRVEKRMEMVVLVELTRGGDTRQARNG